MTHTNQCEHAHTHKHIYIQWTVLGCELRLCPFSLVSECDEQLFVMYSIGTGLYKKSAIPFEMVGEKLNALNVLIQIILGTFSIYIYL